MQNRHDAAWQFVTRFYATPGVEELCLHLQETYGADVIMLLWARWLDELGVDLTPSLLEAANNAVQPWRTQVLLPLRQCRRTAKSLQGVAQEHFRQEHSAVRSALLKAEMEIERRQLRMLTELIEEQCHPATTAETKPCHNVMTYLQSLEIEQIQEEWLNTLDQSITIDRA